MLDVNILGRYEFVGPNPKNKSGQSNKFWHIVFDKSKRQYLSCHGEIGTNGGSPTWRDETKALATIKSKIKKCYKRIEGTTTSVGSNAIHFIMGDD